MSSFRISGLGAFLLDAGTCSWLIYAIRRIHIHCIHIHINLVLHSDYRWDMPCPVCVGYEYADTGKCVQHDEEQLESLWEEVNEMLADGRRDIKRD